MNFLLPQGIGDTIWCMMKIRSVAAGSPIDCFLQYVNPTMAEFRALDFVSRFSFVRSVTPYYTSIHKSEDPYVLEDGIPNYLDTGPIDLPGIDYVMVANGHLHRGGRLEDWLPEHAMDWNVMDEFQIRLAEVIYAERLRRDIGGYAVFFMGSEAGNTVDGHNRGGIWTPQDWADLAKWCVDELKLTVVVVGSEDDASYFDNYVNPLGGTYTNLIGKCGIGQTFAVTRKARFVISYQSGIGIVSQYMGVPGGVFWRQHGDSISSSVYLTNADEMVSGWANPEHIANGNHLPLLYGVHGVDHIKSEVLRRGW